MNRRQFVQATSSLALLGSPLAGLATKVQQLPTRPIPGTDEALPIIGLGNSNAFRQGDLETSQRVISTLVESGGAYVDCSGSSRFVVAEAGMRSGHGEDLFLGSYFSGEDHETSRSEARRLLTALGRSELDLMHGYPEDAVPHWDRFRAWKEEGLTRYIGVARHREEAYPIMMKAMETGTVDFLQVNYSPLETAAEKEILPMARDLGVAVTINRPFINGRYFDVVRGHELPEWAAEFDCESWAQFSLKFILAHPAVTCVLTETANPRHMADNIGAGFGRLPNPDMRQRMLAHVRSLS